MFMNESSTWQSHIFTHLKTVIIEHTYYDNGAITPKEQLLHFQNYMLS